jgi:hypothetical protein
MATQTVTIRPSAAGYSSGMTGGYADIDDVTADDASTQLYATFSSTSSSNAYYYFQFAAAGIPAKTSRGAISSVTLTARWYFSGAITAAGLDIGTGTVPSSAGSPSVTNNAASYPTAYTDVTYSLSASSFDLTTFPTIWGRFRATGAATTGTDVKGATVTTPAYAYCTQVYLTIVYDDTPPISAVDGISVTAQTTSGVTITWPTAANAVSYKVYRDGTLLTTTTSRSYTVPLTDDSDHTIGIVSVASGGQMAAMSTIIRARIPTYTISAVAITAVALTPNPATINSSVAVSVTIGETTTSTTPEIICSGEFYGGE